MAYEPKTWNYNDIITENELNRMEQGIANAHQISEQAQITADSHASRHATGGPDEITPASIGAATADALNAHLNDNAPNSRGNRIYHVEVVSSSVSESPDAGRIIFDTSQGKFFGGNGTEWV